jgi:hypothetical protein
MASIYNYTFDGMSRLGDDRCYVTEKEKQNSQFGTYRTTNYFVNNCGLIKPLEFATSQPNIFVNGGYGNSGAGGCNIDSDSKLKIGSIQHKTGCKVNLFSRPFATVPYLGRGPSNPVAESKLQQGHFDTTTKSCNGLMEKSHIEYRHYPLIPSIQATITNPHNLVEGVAEEGWIKGGLPTRDLIRDQDYMQRHK